MRERVSPDEHGAKAWPGHGYKILEGVLSAWGGV